MAYISNTNKLKFDVNPNQNTQNPFKFLTKTANSTPAYMGASNAFAPKFNPVTGTFSSLIPSRTNSSSTPANANTTYKGTSGVTQSPSSQASTPTLQTTQPLQNTTQNQPASTSKSKGLLSAPSSSSFSGFVGGLMDASQPSKTQKQALLRLQDASQKGQEIARDARNTSQMYGTEIARVGRLGAGAVAGAKTTGTDVVGRGNAAIASESASNRMNALSAGLAAELQGTGQQLTATEQGITGLTNVLTGANTQQQLAQQALAQGGQLAIPSPAAYGQTVFNPLTGQFTGAGGSMDPQVQAQQLAQQVISGGMTYDQALASLGYAGQAGTNFLNNAITGAGGNPLQLQAQGAGQQANISTQTTAGTDIARQGLADATQNYVQLNAAAEFANQQAMAVSDILQQTGLNNVSSADYNKALNNLKGRFSDVNFTALNTALLEARNAYTNLLSSSGMTPTGSEATALSTLDINSSAAAINASIQELENAVARRLQSQFGAVQQYNQNLGTGGTLGGNAGGSGSIWDW